jgi:hypothetical protein
MAAYNSSKKTVTPVAAFVAHMTKARATHEAAVAAGTATSPDYWRGIIEIDFEHAKAYTNATFIKIWYTNPTGDRSPLLWRITNERQCGQIDAATPEGVSWLSQRFPKSKKPFAVRTDKAPTIQVNRFRAKVESVDDKGVLPVYNEDGTQKLPDASQASGLYAAMAILNEIVDVVVNRALDLGRLLSREVEDTLRANNATTPEAIMQAFMEKNGSPRARDIILSAHDAERILKGFGPQRRAAAEAIVLRTTPRLKTVALASMVQTKLSAKHPQAPNQPLLNPLARATIKFDKTTKQPEERVEFFDGSKPIMVDGKKRFDVLTVKDPATGQVQTITDLNIHMAIAAGSLITGTVDVGALCFSELGISVPVKMNIIVVTPPVSREVDLDDVFADMDDGAFAGAGAARGGGGDFGDFGDFAGPSESFTDVAHTEVDTSDPAVTAAAAEAALEALAGF